MEETKVIYHIDDEDTPYLVKLGKHPDVVTLGDFKNVLNRPSYKFFFKSMDDDFGVVKEEISDDEMRLPCFNGRVVAWLVTSDTSSVSGSGGAGDLAADQHSIISSPSDMHLPVQRTVGIGDSRPPSFHPNGGHSTTGDFDSEVDSTISSRRGGSKRREKHGSRGNEVGGHPPRHRIRQPGERFDATSTMSSDIESTSYVDSSDDQSSIISRFSSTTEGSHLLTGRHRRRRRRPRMPRVQRCSSFSTITESTMSLNIITVMLNMVMKGVCLSVCICLGAVDLDGRIEPGDMLLQVNDVNFENMTNDDAVRVLREMVHKPGPITLTVAKCWDPTPKGYFTLPHSDPVRPIDTSAWVQHTTAMNQFAAQQVAQFGDKPPNHQSLSTMTSTSSSMTSSLPESDTGYTEIVDGEPLTLNTDMVTVVKQMAAPESGLDIRDRMWLKITIPNAFIGSDVVDWLYSHVEGFADRREARKYSCNLLKAGYIRHTVNKITFSEQCYYVFGDLCRNMAALSLTEHEHEGDQDTLGPLPPQQHAIPWLTGGPPAYGYHQMPPYPHPHPHAPQPMPVDNKTAGYAHSFYSGTSAHSGSPHSGSPHSGSGSSKRGDRQGDEHRSSGGSSSERSGSSKGKSSVRSEVTAPPMMPPPGPRPLDQVPESVASSRNSFRMAMTNPCEYFVDVM
ncbi:hypothetical protein QZH41_013739 [Actinostola sp. cb2023]|nr:hypothetical protein QZH41_013739 [Actinostola sp. cb2023]